MRRHGKIQQFFQPMARQDAAFEPESAVPIHQQICGFSYCDVPWQMTWKRFPITRRTFVVGTSDRLHKHSLGQNP